MSYNYRKLRGRIKETLGTEDNFAKALGIGRVSLSKRLNCKLDFSQDEIEKAVQALGIKKQEIPIYFFTRKV